MSISSRTAIIAPMMIPPISPDEIPGTCDGGGGFVVPVSLSRELDVGGVVLVMELDVGGVVLLDVEVWPQFLS